MPKYNIEYKVIHFYEQEVMADNKEQAENKFHEWMDTTFFDDEDSGYKIIKITKEDN